MTRPTTERIRAMLGSAVRVDATADGIPRATPRHEEECALLLHHANAEGWTVAVQGSGAWAAPRPAALVIATTGLDGLSDVSPADLVATVRAGTTWRRLQQELGDHGMWLAIDPPGSDRTVGSVTATGTAGPLRSGFGQVREHILGLTIVTGDGKVVRTGGRVVKNVAGYDLAKLVTGSFGAFGIVTELHLRLRTVPRADQTLVGRGVRDELLDAALAIAEGGVPPAALELLSPGATGGDGWRLAVRLLGTDGDVEAGRNDVCRRAGIALADTSAMESAALWRGAAARAVDGQVTVRLGGLPEGLAATLDLVAHHLDDTVEDWMSATVPAGTVRWTGDARIEDLNLLRRLAAEREIPLTVERAPWETLERLGHFGAYREGVGRLVRGLCDVFDPGAVLRAPVGAT
ncbi:MAG TPA: FAD-binding oxidoreductase [Gemmatimonadales bacterium]